METTPVIGLPWRQLSNFKTPGFKRHFLQAKNIGYAVVVIRIPESTEYRTLTFLVFKR